MTISASTFSHLWVSPSKSHSCFVVILWITEFNLAVSVCWTVSLELLTGTLIQWLTTKDYDWRLFNNLLVLNSAVGRSNGSMNSYLSQNWLWTELILCRFSGGNHNCCQLRMVSFYVLFPLFYYLHISSSLFCHFLGVVVIIDVLLRTVPTTSLVLSILGNHKFMHHPAVCKESD